ncbi:MAG: response regulator [Candidatus Cloacimonetes bacterium]|jgi:YesN/AraC family two-component response regulator|nr:response regulator [Candidatus Cloacimonadota bacterium]MBT5419956.1 response regulator [Candidatus Cloacimonadota bacterium]
MNKEFKILIVEDEVMIAEWLKIQLEDEKYDVFDYLTTGEEAIEFVQETKPNVIIMDINLAGEIDGIEAVEKITEKFNIPTIFMSGYEEPEIVERAKMLKPLAYLVKPVGIWDLKPIFESIY